MAFSLTKATANTNKLLDPLLFQVIGSTPESIRDSIMTSTMKNNPERAMLFATACLFASAVNKPTMENFIAKPELQEARPIIGSSFSIGGKSNMTAMTLLGHCILTTSILDGINFAREFRRKMGQDNLWAGNFTKGSLSEKQMEILIEKKRVTNEKTAKLLGSGFFKFTGMDSRPYTDDEADFWDEPRSKGGVALNTTIVEESTTRSAVSSPSVTPPRKEKGPTAFALTLSNGSQVAIPSDVYTYYTTVISDNLENMVESVERNTVKGFVAKYRHAISRDPDMTGAKGTSVV
jgi:hypothetical protein